MKKIFIILFGVILFAVVNIVPLHLFISNLKGHSEYKKGDYPVASGFFNAAANVYNIANSYYKQGAYEAAIEFYELEEEKNHEIYHNIGNSYYFLSIEEKTSLSKKLSLLKKALSNYKKAEIIKLDEDTTINKKIVEAEIQRLEDAIKKADEEENRQQEENQGQSEQDQNSQEESDQNSDEESEQEDGTENTQETEDEQENIQESESGENSEETSQGEEGSETNEDGQDEGEKSSGAQEQGEVNESGLSEEQQAAIENYSENLERSQQEYGEYYNKTYRENRSGFDSFFGNDPFFDNSLLENGKEKKDW